MYCSAVASSLTVAEVLSPLAVKLMMDGLKQLFPFIWHTSTVRSPASDGSKVPLNDGAATSGGRKKKCSFPVPCAPSAMIPVGRPPAGAGVVISAGPPQAVTRTRAATTQNAMDFIRTPHDRGDRPTTATASVVPSTRASQAADRSAWTATSQGGPVSGDTGPPDALAQDEKGCAYSSSASRRNRGSSRNGA